MDNIYRWNIHNCIDITMVTSYISTFFINKVFFISGFLCILWWRRNESACYEWINGDEKKNCSWRIL